MRNVEIEEVFAMPETADEIILALRIDMFKELISIHGDGLSGEIIIDPSGPIDLDGNGGLAQWA